MKKIIALLGLIITLNVHSLNIRVSDPTKTLEAQGTQGSKVVYNPKKLSKYSSRSISASNASRFTVTILVRDKHCTGSFIGKRKILTAKHCFENKRGIAKRKVKSMTLIYYWGSREAYRETFYKRNLKVKLHKKLDIAVVDFKINPMAKGQRHLPTLSDDHISSYDDLFRKNIYIAGSGDNNIDEDIYLGLAKSRLISIRQDKRYHDLKHTASKQGVCIGDSGSPVMINDPDVGAVLIGVLVSIFSSKKQMLNEGCSRRSRYIRWDSNLEKWAF